MACSGLLIWQWHSDVLINSCRQVLYHSHTPVSPCISLRW